MITDINGDVKEKRQFDAWGNIVKLTDGAGNPLNASLILDRGYTGHEHLLGVGLINMNGRLYDPLLHRFFSPDDYIQDPTNTQNFNRYGYVLNNPLSYTDKNGKFWQFVIGALVGAVYNVVTNWGEIHSIGNFFSYAGVGAASGIAAAAGQPVLAGSILSGGNNLISQVNANGWGNINFGQLATSTLFGAATSYYGRLIGGKVTSLVGSKIASPLISSALSGIISNGITGLAVGTGMSLMNGKSLGESLKDGLRGAAMGGGIGFITGTVEGYIYAKNNNLGLLTGRDNTILEVAPGPSPSSITIEGTEPAFSDAASLHMEDPDRMVPVHILKQAIVDDPGSPDLNARQPSKAITHRAIMWRNNKPYHLEVVHDPELNKILHFQYDRNFFGFKKR